MEGLSSTTTTSPIVKPLDKIPSAFGWHLIGIHEYALLGRGILCLLLKSRRDLTPTCICRCKRCACKNEHSPSYTKLLKKKETQKDFQSFPYCKVDCSHQRMNNQDKLDKIKSLEKLGMY